MEAGRTARTGDTSPTPRIGRYRWEPSPRRKQRHRVDRAGHPPWALQAVVAAYGGNAYRLLTDLADLVETSVAYVDRPTVRPIWNGRCPTTIGRPSPRTGARRPFGAARLTHLLAECRP